MYNTTMNLKKNRIQPLLSVEAEKVKSNETLMDDQQLTKKANLMKNNAGDIDTRT